ncbi:RNA-guided endonuclease IscB [Streptomyces sp. NPDC048696]|uniref:RNA-guided endonuclease IscB n=1 Tax=Streptomyces sp. NPDC048696 TaxID=3365585 RepID=UPI0037235DC3
MFVLAKGGEPLMPCHPARARELLAKGRAVVARQAPFAIRLRDRSLADSEIDGVQLRVDPGSKGTGLCLTDERKEAARGGPTVTVRRGLVSAELQHRGDQIHRCMQQRAGYRRRRRSDNCRYRARRSANRTYREGWLPPSLRHRVDTTVSTVRRLCRYAPVAEIHIESVAFDMHVMSVGKPLHGVEYQQGLLAGTDVREYLRELWSRTCAYCGTAGVALNIDHIRPRSHGGSDRVSNLVLACVGCNQAKGSRSIEEFLAHDPARLAEILSHTKAPLRDAAAVNATRQQLTDSLGVLGVPVHTWSGRGTKGNRNAMRLTKTHTLDALCVGPLDHEQGDVIVRVPHQIHVIKATGRGSYARTTPDRFGFPRLQRPRAKLHHGFITGDLVRAIMPSGRWKGTWTGRVSVRTRGQHSLTTSAGRFNVLHRNLRLLQRADGYAYASKKETPKIS